MDDSPGFTRITGPLIGILMALLVSSGSLATPRHMKCLIEMQNLIKGSLNPIFVAVIGLFKVFITNRVIEKIGRDVNRPFERIGLLMGTLEDQSLWVNEIIPGMSETDTVSCTFPRERLAQVAADIVEGRITGKIVGWYHSHPGHGLFLSQTDLDTHMQFYQFSAYSLSLVVDPKSQEFGIWIYESGIGVVQLPSTYIHII